MGGGGTIIIRNAMKSTLSDPLIHGLLPDCEKAVVDPILAKDVNDWTAEEQHLAAKAFFWVCVNH
jgi:hypothetical protein